MLASFAEALVDAFNWKLGVGLWRDGSQTEDDCGVKASLESPPDWTSGVKPLAERLKLRRSDGDGACPIFEERNIDAPMGNLYCL